jgi:hypothetical protein
MHKKLTILALSLGFVGALLAFLDAHRTASRFSEAGVSLGFGPEYSTWFWRSCGRLGMGLIGAAFLLELFGAVFCQEQELGGKEARQDDDVGTGSGRTGDKPKNPAQENNPE